MLRRTGFAKPPRPEREPVPLRPATRRSQISRCDVAQEAQPKTNPLQHVGYMKAVRDLGYCQLCGRWCRPQFCHRDEGKGTGIKTDCREGWNGCADCHHKVGTERIYEKERRRLLELNLGALTRAAVLDAGTWPKRLPMWTAIEQLKEKT
jgi:hypothetical protein